MPEKIGKRPPLKLKSGYWQASSKQARGAIERHQTTTLAAVLCVLRYEFTAYMSSGWAQTGIHEEILN